MTIENLTENLVKSELIKLKQGLPNFVRRTLSKMYDTYREIIMN